MAAVCEVLPLQQQQAGWCSSKKTALKRNFRKTFGKVATKPGSQRQIPLNHRVPGCSGSPWKVSKQVESIRQPQRVLLIF